VLAGGTSAEELIEGLSIGVGAAIAIDNSSERLSLADGHGSRPRSRGAPLPAAGGHLHFAVASHRPAGLFERGEEQCLILAPTHRSVLDPWLIMSALRFRQWRVLVPIRTLASRTFKAPLQWFTPLIRILYRLEGVVELPPKEEGGTLPEKVQGLLDALRGGDVVAIFPEGGVWKKRSPPVATFAPGVVYLQRRSGADIVPMAMWMSERRWPRRRCVISHAGSGAAYA
jgi:hypothetical protein